MLRRNWLKTALASMAGIAGLDNMAKASEKTISIGDYIETINDDVELTTRGIVVGMVEPGFYLSTLYWRGWHRRGYYLDSSLAHPLFGLGYWNTRYPKWQYKKIVLFYAINIGPKYKAWDSNKLIEAHPIEGLRLCELKDTSDYNIPNNLKRLRKFPPNDEA